MDVPQANGVVGGATGEDGAGWVEVDCPERSLVAVVCSQPLAIVGVPCADVLVLGDRQDKVSVFVVPRGRSVPRGEIAENEGQARARRGEAYLIWVKARSWKES